MSQKTAWRLLNPERAAAQERRRQDLKEAWAREHYRKPCVECGAEIRATPRTVICSECYHIKQRVRYPEIRRRWDAGESLSEIAAALGTTVNVVGGTMVRMRRQGWDLPYRRKRVAA